MQKTILYPPTIDWEFMFQRPQQIMRQFARHGWRVIYCNKTQEKGAELREVEPNLFVCRDLLKYIHEYGNKIDVFYTTWAKCCSLVSAFESKVVVYDRVDYFKEWSIYEEFMIKNADVVFCTSQNLLEFTNHHNVHLVRNACDFEHFNTTKEVVSLENQKKPILGFIGALGAWVDKEVLNYLADNYTLLIVGERFGIDAPKNSIFIGYKPYKELPSYYNSIDIGIIPFDITSMVAQCANPIKMYEYLASGKPVLASETIETSLFPGNVYTYGHIPYRYLDNIIKEILEGENATSKLERMQIAKENTWENRFKIIEREINRVWMD